MSIHNISFLHMLWVLIRSTLVGCSYEYPQRMFSLRNKTNIDLIIWILFLAVAMKSLSQDK